MIVQDDRTDEQKRTHRMAVVAYDTSMTRGMQSTHEGKSRCAWAFNPSEVNDDRVYNWVKSRPEMKYVNLVEINQYRCPRGTGHFHIYVVGPNSSAAKF